MDAHKDHPHAGPDSIFDAAAICRAQLEQCCTRPALNEDHWARNRLADFSLWNAGVGATAKKHMSLDVRLQKDDAARSVVIGILSTLTAWTKKCSDLAEDDLQPQRPPPLTPSAPTLGVSAQSKANEPGLRAASPTPRKDEDDESEITLTEAKNSIEELLHTIVVIGLAIRRAGTASRHRQADRTFESDSNTQEYEDLKDHLEFLLRLPLLLKDRKASKSPDASSDVSSHNASHVAGPLEIEKIGLSPEQLILLKATLKRRHRIRFAQTQGMKLKDLRLQSPEESTMPRQTNAPALDMSHIKISEAAEGKSRDTGKPEYSAAALEKYAHSTVSKPSDYAAGQSLEQQIQTQNEGVAATIVAMHADYPKPPPTIDGIQVFQCPYCHLTFPIELSEATSLWRKHVSEDIQPYTCFLPTCSMQNGNFNTLEAWKSHIQRDHRLTEYWRCFVCEDRFENEALLSAHIKTLHADVIPADDLSAIVQMCLAYDKPRINICPVCSINKTDWEKNEKEDKLSTIPGTNSFLDHIGQCLHDFSLRSLPEETFAEQVHESYDTDRNASNQTPRSYPASSFDFSEGPGYENDEDLTAQILHQIPKRYDNVKEFCVAWCELALQTIYEPPELDDTQIALMERPGVPSSIPQTSEGHIFLPKHEGTTSSDNPRKLLIAVDFGLSFTHVAYTFTSMAHGQKTELHVITHWGTGTSDSEGVPTTLKYEDDGSYRWGYQIGDDEAKYQWFQLGLSQDFEKSDLSRRYPSRTALPPFSDMEYEKLVIDYLAALRKHVDEHLKARLSEVVFRTQPRQFVITVPSTFPESVRARMLACAEIAGLGKRNSIHTVTEMEAAAMYILDTTPTINLKIGDTFVICNAGTRTVDLTSYAIEGLQPTIRISEAASGSGGACGEMFLGRIFATYLEMRFQNYPAWDMEYQHDAMWYFENRIKRTFGLVTDEVFFIPARGQPDNPALGIRRGKLELPRQIIYEIFEPVMREILQLVRGQIEATRTIIKAIIFFGEFGGNAYLRARVQDEVGPNIPVMVPENSNTAVVKGALIQALAMVDTALSSIRLVERIARRHYGTLADVPFDPTKHDEKRRVLDVATGQFRVEVMHWFLTKGSVIQEGTSIRLPFYSNKRVADGRPGSIDMTIYVCHHSIPPVYKDENVSEFARLKINLNDIPVEKLPLKRDKNEEQVYVFDYDLEMTMRSESIAFALAFEGMTYEVVETDFL